MTNKDTNENQNKKPLYKRLMRLGIIVAVAFYCFPELREKLDSYIRFFKDEWRKIR